MLTSKVGFAILLFALFAYEATSKRRKNCKRYESVTSNQDVANGFTECTGNSDCTMFTKPGDNEKYKPDCNNEKKPRFCEILINRQGSMGVKLIELGSDCVLTSDNRCVSLCTAELRHVVGGDTGEGAAECIEEDYLAYACTNQNKTFCFCSFASDDC